MDSTHYASLTAKAINDSVAPKRYIPAGYVAYVPDIGDYPKDLFACYVDFNRVSAIFYTKKQSKSTFFNRFHTVDDMKKKINNTIANIMANEDRKKDRATKRKAPTTLKKGDVLYSSWGYDQTNITFYKVVKVIGSRTVQIVKIGNTIVSDNGPTTYVAPDVNRVIGKDVMTKRVSDGHITINSYARAYPYDGVPKYETGFGYGH